MTSPLNVVVLAAGKGTRMYSALPKVLHRLAGKPLLAHVLDCAAGVQPEKTVVVYGYGGEQVRQTIDRANIQWVNQAEQLGTGHAVMQALPALDGTGTTLILYGDVPLTTTRTLATIVNHSRSGNPVLLTVELENPAGYGRIVRDGNGFVKRIVEHKDATEQERLIREINTGIMAVPTAQLVRWLGQLSNDNAQGEYYLTDVIGMAVAEGVEVVTCHPDHEWEILGVNSKPQLAELERLYQAQEAQRLMAQGVTLLDPSRFDLRGNLSCGQDVTIDVNCVFEGEVTLGNNVVVGANCVLRDVVIEDGVKIEPFSLLEQARAGAASKIGPFSRLRPGTVLGQDVHVGNFVEIKNSQVDTGSKINHLSYVGDSTVGKKVNIGAGTITCNYDGANKHRTVIEDEAFIGSDTQLVAPVRVGRGATIGAGSTITRDAPADTLTLSRPKQLSVEGWKRPQKKKPS